jgi:hypothetical protein
MRYLRSRAECLIIYQPENIFQLPEARESVIPVSLIWYPNQQGRETYLFFFPVIVRSSNMHSQHKKTQKDGAVTLHLKPLCADNPFIVAYSKVKIHFAKCVCAFP